MRIDEKLRRNNHGILVIVKGQDPRMIYLAREWVDIREQTKTHTLNCEN